MRIEGLGCIGIERIHKLQAGLRLRLDNYVVDALPQKGRDAV